MSKEAMKLDDKAVAQILSRLPSPPVGDGSALHAWAMQVARKLAEGVPETNFGNMAEQPAPVQGWKLVPVEPTQKMLDAPPNAYPADALVTWKAMLAAAPQPPAQRKPMTKQERDIIHAATGSMTFFKAVEHAIIQTEEFHNIKAST